VKNKVITPLLVLTLAAQVAPQIYAQAADEHAVFAMTNSEEGNQIIAYSRAADGSLIERSHFATGGRLHHTCCCRHQTSEKNFGGLAADHDSYLSSWGRIGCSRRAPGSA
jgi:hypothetical protein